MKLTKGTKVKVTSNNENYISFKEKILIVTHIARSLNQHPGYDNAVEGEALCDFIAGDGTEVPFSLYEREFKII
jgi:hypothetical protein